MSIAVLHILSDLSDPSLSRKLHMFNMRILAKYAVILRAVGIVLVMERWWTALGASENHNAPTFKKSAPPSSKNHTTPLYSALRAHTLMPVNVFQHESESFRHLTKYALKG